MARRPSQTAGLIKVRCPNPACRKILAVKSVMGGKRARCPLCGQMMAIPKIATPPAPTAADEAAPAPPPEAPAGEETKEKEEAPPPGPEAPPEEPAPVEESAEAEPPPPPAPPPEEKAEMPPPEPAVEERPPAAEAPETAPPEEGKRPPPTREGPPPSPPEPPAEERAEAAPPQEKTPPGGDEVFFDGAAPPDKAGEPRPGEEQAPTPEPGSPETQPPPASTRLGAESIMVGAPSPKGHPTPRTLARVAKEAEETGYELLGGQLRVVGAIGYDLNTGFRDKCDQLLASGEKELLVDLSQVLYLSSSHIGVIARLATDAMKDDRKVRVRVSGKVARVLKFAGIDRLVEIENIDA